MAATFKPRWFHLTLQGMLVIVALLAIGLAFLGTKIKRARDEQKIVQAILASGGQQVHSSYFGMDAKPEGPKETWFERFIGLDLETRASAVTLRGQFGQPLTDADIEQLAGLPELTSIAASHGQVTGEAIAKLKGLEQLQYLSLDESGLTDEGLLAVADLPALNDLRLQSERGITDDGFDAFFRRRPKLRVLIISNRPIKGAALKSLHYCPGLVHLTISIADDEIGGIAQLQSLSTLNINGKITDEGVRHLASLQALRSLSITGTLTDDALREIGSLPNLESLTVHGSEFTDNGLRHLADLQSLDNLRVSSQRGAITDAGVKHLAKLKRLKFLELRGNTLSAEGVERLQQALPGIYLQ